MIVNRLLLLRLFNQYAIVRRIASVLLDYIFKDKEQTPWLH